VDCFNSLDPFEFGGGGGFDPYSIAWDLALDATTGRFQTSGGAAANADSDPVGQWQDQSGNARHVEQATAGNRPLVKLAIQNALPVIRTDGVDDLLRATFTVNPVFTRISAIIPSLTGTEGYYSGSTANAGALYTVNDNKLYSYSGSFGPSATTTAVAQIVTELINGSKTKLYINALRRGWGDSGSTAPGGITLGAFNNDSVPALCDYCQLFQKDGLLASTSRMRTQAFLNAKWGIGINYSTIKQVFFDGNSITLGSGLSDPSTQSYPAQVIATLGVSWNGVNIGVSGAETATLAADADYRIKEDYDPTFGKNIAVLWEVTNDLHFNQDPAGAYSRYAAWCADVRASGINVLAVTCLPRGGEYAGFEADRQTVNTNIRNNWTTFADRLVDVAGDSRIGDSGDQNDATYYQGDAIHLNETGAGVVAGLVVTQIQSL